MNAEYQGRPHDCSVVYAVVNFSLWSASLVWWVLASENRPALSVCFVGSVPIRRNPFCRNPIRRNANPNPNANP